MSSEKSADQANREVFLALAQGLDLFWNDLSAGRAHSGSSRPMRARMLQTSEALDPAWSSRSYDSHGPGAMCA